MRRAVREGVSVERIQLFRGASLGWLDVLTTGAASRMADGTASPGNLNLFLSVEQPHTVSVLVVGDIEEAQRSGNIRDIRVAVLIEAATVEPDGGGARVRVARCGLYSSRPEFLASVQQFILSLKREHKRLVKTLLAEDDGLIARCLSPSGAIVATADAETMDRLRERFCGIQIGQWANQIRDELAQPKTFDNEDALGVWLTELMVRTDILDIEALKRLLVQPTESGWVANTNQLQTFLDNPLSLVPALARPASRHPLQPILAADVHRDNLERWVGWKRFVHGVQSIPGQRGKDMDVVFREEEIQRRIARWFRKINRLGNETPGKYRAVLAGDGMTPTRERDGHAWDVVVAHRDLIANSNVNYLRIQHTCGTNFSWMKDICGVLVRRDGGEPAGIQWEEAHGAVVNIVMLCSRSDESPINDDMWTLDGWNIEACSVLISDLHERGISYKLALFTESITGAPPSQELIHFGRSHCEGLLRQGGVRSAKLTGVSSARGLDGAVIPQLERWVRRLIGAGYAQDISRLESDEERIGWVMQQLGIVDRSLAAALVQSLNLDGTVHDAAQRVWSDIRPWPGHESTSGP